MVDMLSNMLAGMVSCSAVRLVIERVIPIIARSVHPIVLPRMGVFGPLASTPVRCISAATAVIAIRISIASSSVIANRL